MIYPSPAQSLAVLRSKWSRGTLEPGIIAILDQVQPDWRLSPSQRQWHTKLDELVSWRKANGRFPRKGVTTLSPEEKSLGEWLNTQRLGTGSTNERRALLDEHLPGWDKTRQSDN